MSQLINKIILPNKGFLYLIASIIFVFSWIHDLYRKGVKPKNKAINGGEID